MENKAVIINKYEIVNRCIQRIKEEYENIDVIENHLNDVVDFVKTFL